MNKMKKKSLEFGEEERAEAKKGYTHNYVVITKIVDGKRTCNL